MFYSCLRPLLACCLVVSAGALADSGNQKIEEQFIDDARASISQCSQVHEMDAAAQRQITAVRIAQQHLKAAGGADDGTIITVDDSALSVSEKFPHCRDEVEHTLLPRANDFVESFVSANERKQARRMVVQWRAALNAIPSPTAASATDRFETLANQLIGAMPTN